MPRRELDTVTLALIPVAIAVNIAIGQIVYAIKIPLYLDSIGTVLVGVLAGPWAGALTGMLSNLIWALTGMNVSYAPFAAVAAVIGLMAGVFGSAGFMRRPLAAAAGGLTTGLVAAVLSAPISAYVFGGLTGSGTDALFLAFRHELGVSVLGAAAAQGAVSDPVDKTATFLLVWAVLQALPYRFLARFPQGEDVAPPGLGSPSETA
jgi:energy-coupling factor transport system substrate-specific component